MTEREYKAKEKEFDKLYAEIDNLLDHIGFGDYNDGAGDYGTRRLYRDDRLVLEITINDMVDTGYGEFPDHIFYHRDTDTVIDTVDKLYTLVTNHSV